ncbi:hypothetical protein [Pontibacter akesuensis]|uniref:Uncharacterized protein n=1 Tax=Pontibacter akesuensis TaxID=388950 RepID=A0A1I7KKU6_9BACT|nr:hypothetical protein [Pontibacter akesuensis]GHA78090.1 hypothetical protein GCM10007389_34990 [Pontibacter akesuensis]SFU98055.1 hypothetical protein SAMN04487941_3810 [Pontibacter akesuensis]
MRRHNPKLATFVHLMTVLVLLLKGTDKLTHEYWLSGSILVLLGLLVLALVVLEKRLHLNHHNVRQTCLLIESFALFVMALVFYQEGRQYLQYVFGACALTYLAVAIVEYRKHKATGH